MEWLLTQAVTAILVPPGSVLLLSALGAVLTLRGRRGPGIALLVFSWLALYALSTPIVAQALIATLEPPPLDPRTARDADAIVVLGGGSYPQAPEYGVDTVSEATLVRLRYAARLHRALDKPVLVAGGAPAGSALTEAEQMRQALQLDFHAPVRWAEAGSNNTLENARLSFRLLAPDGLKRVYLVTDAWHMPRARLAFERAGFEVVAAPTGYLTHGPRTLLDFLPSARALHYSRHFVHEVIGIGWYHLRLLTARQETP